MLARMHWYMCAQIVRDGIPLGNSIIDAIQ
jgi:hypothetical protein